MFIKFNKQYKKKFVANVIQVEMQHRHLYTSRHATRVTNVVVAYQIKHEIVNNDMV